ncbi:MAG: hypothetical protein FJX46_12915 [Alphaproteobacteria bacterium]|nr:hypothetical protein [Alphaproteobacteria bacterium]
MAGPRLSIVVQSGEFERVHYALAMASAALAIGRPATLFFTMGACRALLPGAADSDWARRDADFATSKVATFRELLPSVVTMGGRLMVCEMGLRAEGIERRELRADLPIEDGGLVTFLHDHADGLVVMA